MSETKHSLIDTIKIHKAIEAGVPLLITTYTLPHEMEVYMNEVLTFFLKELNHEYMTEYLTYCLSELTTNAKKANTKRIYFAEQHLDINNESDYQKGMKTFMRDTMANINSYLAKQKSAGLFIKLLLQVRNGKIKIEIRNNVPLTVFEYKRIHDKIARAQQYGSIEDAFSQIIDETEGAGLGLIIMILMLQRIGLSDDNLCYLSENNETITRIILPLDSTNQSNLETISTDIVKLIDELPHFPDNIVSINNLLNDPKPKLSSIAQNISNDVSLTADLLKLVNSAAFSLRTPCQNITKAVQLVGTRGIKNLLYSLGSMKTLGNNSNELKDLWTHCYQVAFYSYNLARNFFAREREIIEDSYVCGLLHDIGKVLFKSAQPDLAKKFEALCAEKNIPNRILENLYAGASHAKVGSLIAEKWNFPDVIIQSIRFHHNPNAAPAQFKKITYIVYMANMLTHYQSEIIEYYQFEDDVLAEFKITSEESLMHISSLLKDAFETE